MRRSLILSKGNVRGLEVGKMSHMRDGNTKEQSGKSIKKAVQSVQLFEVFVL